MAVEAPSSPDGLHADGRRDGVANGDADEVSILYNTAEHDLGAAEVGADGVHVGVVAFARLRVARAVALGEQRGRVVGDEGEEEHGGRAGDPAELRDGPGQGEHAGADDSGDDVGAGRPERAGATRAAVVVQPRGGTGVAGLDWHLHGRNRVHVTHSVVRCRCHGHWARASELWSLSRISSSSSSSQGARWCEKLCGRSVLRDEDIYRQIAREQGVGQ